MLTLCSKLAYYAGIMLNALACLLCLKLCRHNRRRPTTSVNFTFNTADSSGGAIYLTNHSRVLFIDQSTLYQTDDTFVNEKVNKMFLFYQNRASEFDKDIYAYHHSNVMFGNNVRVMFTDDGQHFDSTTNALYADFYSNITFEGNSEVTFKNNKYSYCGALCIHDRSEVTFKGNTIVKFSDNIGDDESAAMCVNSSTAIFTEHSTVTFNNNTKVGALNISSFSSVIFDESSTVMFSNNKANYGGAVDVIGSNIIFKGNSLVNFNHNQAVGDGCGGAMYIMDDCDVTFEENCTVKFNKNIANYGGATYIKGHNIAVTFKGNSSVIFNDNEAKGDGGAIHIGDYSKAIVTFMGNSKVSFSNNKASEDGGVLFISRITNSPFTFGENSKINFNNNSANNGGVVYSYCSCANTKLILVFIGRSKTMFDNNESKNKGGVVCAESSDIRPYDNCYPIQFGDHSRVTFTDNKSAKGGAIYVGFTINIKSLQNSTLIFNNNTARIGGAIFSYEYYIIFQGNSHARFSNNLALQNGGVLFCSSQCNVSFNEDSTVTFSHNEAAPI